MRNKLIKRIQQLSLEVDFDDLGWQMWERYSNLELIAMLEKIVEQKVLDQLDIKHQTML